MYIDPELYTFSFPAVLACMRRRSRIIIQPPWHLRTTVKYSFHLELHFAHHVKRHNLLNKKVRKIKAPNLNHEEAPSLSHSTLPHF